MVTRDGFKYIYGELGGWFVGLTVSVGSTTSSGLSTCSIREFTTPFVEMYIADAPYTN